MTEIKFTASHELMEKIERVKGLLGHQLKDFSYAAILDHISDLAIQKYDPREKSPRSPKAKKPRPAVTPAQEVDSYTSTPSAKHSTPAA